MAFTVGQKVVCVDASANKNFAHEVPLVQGGIYTVIRVIAFPLGSPGLLIAESATRAPFGFDSLRFRPIVERRTEISFTTGADPESEKWDNRRPAKVYEFDTAAHEEILSYLRGFY